MKLSYCVVSYYFNMIFLVVGYIIICMGYVNKFLNFFKLIFVFVILKVMLKCKLCSLEFCKLSYDK